MFRAALVFSLSLALLSGCGKEADLPVYDDQGNLTTQGELSERRALEERIITGRNIVIEAPWTCELSDETDTVVIVDEYSFLIDRLGVAADGFFEWHAIDTDAVHLAKHSGSDSAYTIGGIRFESDAFEDDAFEGTLDGIYFEDGLRRSYAMRCTRESPALF